MAIVDDIRRKQEATKGLVSIEQMERMRVLWKKGRNMFASFFAEADAVKQQIGNSDLFSQWCFFQLQIDVATMGNMAAILRQGDAARIRTEFAEAKRAEKERQEADAHTRRMEAQERKNALDAKKAANAFAKAAKEAEAKKAKTAAIAAVRKARKIARAEKEGDDLTRAMQAIMANPNASRDEIRNSAEVSRPIYDKARAVLESKGKISPKAPEPDETAYDKLVSEGIKENKSLHGIPINENVYDRAVAACRPLADAPWIIGDWAILVAGEAVYGEGTLQRFAADIRVEYSTLRDYAAVAKAWPPNGVRPSFSLANILRNHPDRASIGHNSKHMTCEEAREIMRKYKAETNVVTLRERS